jgi:hypothetical protein
VQSEKFCLMNWTGSDGVRFWDMKTIKEVPSARPPRLRGQVTCITWVSCLENCNELLCYGTGLGYVVFTRQATQDVSDGIY